MRYKRVAAVSLTVAILFNTVASASDFMSTVGDALVKIGFAYVQYKLNYTYPIRDGFRTELIEYLIREEVERQLRDTQETMSDKVKQLK